MEVRIRLLQTERIAGAKDESGATIPDLSLSLCFSLSLIKPTGFPGELDICAREIMESHIYPNIVA
jgi:hypothetical protein